MHHNIAAYEAAVRRHVTVLIPWDGQNEDLLRETIRSLPRGVRVVIAKNAGKHEMAAALNGCLDHITTKWVFVMGSDDVLDSKTLWRLWEAALDYDGSYPWMLAFGAQRFRFPAEPWSPLRIQDKNVCGAFLIKTRVLRAVGGWRDSVIEDWDLMYRVAEAGYRLNPAPLARYGYRQRHDGLHRSTVREAQKLKLTWADLAPYEERKPITGVFYEWKLDGTGYVRCELASRTAGGCVRTTFDMADDHEASAWVFQYPNSDAREMWDYAKKIGKKRVIDVDDNYLADDLHDIVGEYHKKNAIQWAKRQASHREMCEEADYIICATPRLAEWYSETNKNVIVCENSVDPLDWPRKAKRKRIVGAVLSTNHLSHMNIVRDALRVAAGFKDVEVQVVGLDPEWDFPYTHIGFTPGVASYRRVLSRWSVGLAPVVDNNLTSCKSDLKWLEYTMSGAVLIASDVEAYRRVPDDCILRAQKPEDFTEATIEVLRDKKAAQRLVRNSVFHVERDRLVGNESLRSRYNTALV